MHPDRFSLLVRTRGIQRCTLYDRLDIVARLITIFENTISTFVIKTAK